MYDSVTYATEPTPGKRTAHSYDVEAMRPGLPLTRKRFNVWASNRTQAAARVKKDGWQIMSVNMTG